MDRRQFATRCLAVAAGAVLHRRSSYAAAASSAEQVPGSVPDSFIEQARFPEGFIWGTATEMCIRDRCAAAACDVDDAGCARGVGICNRLAGDRCPRGARTNHQLNPMLL